MKTRNEVIIAGHVGRDPERKGNGPFKFSVATGGGKKKDGSGNWPTLWHTIVCWPKQIDCTGVKKGDAVEIQGRLTYPEWTAKDGTKQKGCEIVASALMLEPKTEAAPPVTPRSYSQPMNRQSDFITDEDIPF